MRIPCTVAVLTYNRATTLPRCLDSVKDFSEIIVCDGGSTDQTLDVARTFGARILNQDPAYLNAEGRIVDFSGVRNQTLAASCEPWFFFLDSDEEASLELVQKIRFVVSHGQPGAYWVARRYVYGGKDITCSASYPNQQMRFFHRAAAIEFRKKVHERIVVHPDTSVGKISEPILVPIASDIASLDAKMGAYIEIEVGRLRAIGRPALVRAIRGGIKNIASFFYRYVRSVACCRGTRLPFSVESRALWYQVDLIRACVRSVWRV